MVNLPQELLDALPNETVEPLLAALAVIEDEISGVYEMDARDHEEGIGDSPRLFGLKIYEHLWFAVRERLRAIPGVLVAERAGAHCLIIAGLEIGIYKLGNLGTDEIDERFPNGSPTKEAYVQRNEAQGRLFDPLPGGRLSDEQGFQLRTWVIGHFGNPRQALVKWYVGAPTADAAGHRYWAWRYRQGHEPGGHSWGDGPSIGPVQPFDDRPTPEVGVRLRRGRSSRQVDGKNAKLSG